MRKTKYNKINGFAFRWLKSIHFFWSFSIELSTHQDYYVVISHAKKCLRKEKDFGIWIESEWFHNVTLFTKLPINKAITFSFLFVDIRILELFTERHYMPVEKRRGQVFMTEWFPFVPQRGISETTVMKTPGLCFEWNKKLDLEGRLFLTLRIPPVPLSQVTYIFYIN